jgi:hypothetical protein
MPQFGASLTDDARVIIYDHSMFIVQAGGVNAMKLTCVTASSEAKKTIVRADTWRKNESEMLEAPSGSFTESGRKFSLTYSSKPGYLGW